MLREFSRLLSFLSSHYKSYIILIILDSLIVAVLPVLISYALRDMIDASIQRDIDLLVRSGVMICATFLFFSIFAPMVHYFLQRIVKKTMADIRLTTFDHLMKLPISYFDQQHHGEVISRLSNDITKVEQTYGLNMQRMIQSLFMLVFAVVFMLITDWRFSVILILITIVAGIVNHRFIQPLRQVNDRMQEDVAKMTSKVSDILDGYKVIKMFPIGKLMVNRFSKVNQDVSKTYVQEGNKLALLDALNFFIGFALFGGMIVTGIVIYSKEELGILGQLVQLQTTLIFVFMGFGKIIASMQQSLSGAKRIFDLLDSSIEKEDQPLIKDRSKEEVVEEIVKEEHKSALSFDNVSFHYLEDQSVLHQLSFSIQEGKAIAIVGDSGCGKSTLFKLIMGFYPPVGGEIFLFEKPFQQHTLKEWRGLISYVSQDSYLFEGTIKENIKDGQVQASEEQLIQAAKHAYAHDFIMQLPDQYETLVGENGAKLSGGQRQRIAIARALLKDAPILLLDEPTSALDTDSEMYVRQALTHLMENRTTLIITHRLTMTENLDEIYVMDQGRIVEKGTYHDLIEGRGLFYQLFEKENQHTSHHNQKIV